MRGILIMNQSRPDIAFDNGTLLGGLHCGDTFSCFFHGSWKHMRLELAEDWIILCDNKVWPVPYGASVKI